MNEGYLASCQKQTARRTVAFDFSRVNYGSEVFAAVNGPGEGRNLNDVSALADVGSASYSWLQDGVVTRMEGIVRVRELSGEGDWVFVDLLHSASSERGAMCGHCTAANGHPVHHRGQPCTALVAGPLSASDIVQPDAARFEGCGVQVSRKPALPKLKGSVRRGDSNLTVALLKPFLRKHGLSTKGRRDDLLARAKKVTSAELGVVAQDVGGGGADEEEEEEEEEEECESDEQNDRGDDDDDDDDDADGAYVPLKIHDRKTYKRAISGKTGKASERYCMAMTYQVEWEGYPDPDDYTWAYDYELEGGASELMSRYNMLNPFDVVDEPVAKGKRGMNRVATRGRTKAAHCDEIDTEAEQQDERENDASLPCKRRK